MTRSVVRQIRSRASYVQLMLRGPDRAGDWRGNADDVASYHHATRAEDSSLSDQVWSDLELDAVFARVDRCSCCLGQQLLYDMMRRPLLDADAVARRGRLIAHLSANPAVREELARAVRPLRNNASYDIHRFISDELPRIPAWAYALPLLSAAAIAAFAVMTYQPLAGLLLLLLVIACNVLVHIGYRPGVQHLIRPIGALTGLVSAARAVAHIADPDIAAHAHDLNEHCSRLGWSRWLFLHLGRENSGNELSAALAGYANLLFLADMNAFVFSIGAIRRHRADVREVVRILGTLDALSAVAAFRDELPVWCVPQLHDDTGAVRAKSLYYPGLPSPVPNDLNVESGSVLVTGSNMAGKSTYLRAVGVGAVLSQTIATCPAASWQAPCFVVDTLIDRADDLAGGRSYFLVEAEHVARMLRSSAEEQPHLYILDELFRGTNTRERLAASRAVLDRLNSGAHTCMVSTHDLDLVDLLETEWSLWHFQESFDGTEMTFDYRIREGSAGAGNALELLKRSGYPADVMAEARATFERLGTL